MALMKPSGVYSSNRVMLSKLLNIFDLAATRRKVFAVIVLVSLLFAFGVYAAALLLEEDLYSQKGTMAYYVTISSLAIKEFPLIGQIKEELYYYSSGDGPKPSANGVSYLSNAPQEMLETELSNYLRGKGFVVDKSLSGGYFIKLGSKTGFELRITKEQELTRVVGTEFYPD